MSDTRRFPFYANYWRSIRGMKPAKRDRFVCAICAYVFDGEVPDFGGDDALEGRWCLIQSSLDASMAAAQSGSRGGAKAPAASERKAPSEDAGKAPSEGPLEDSPKGPSGNPEGPSEENDKQYRTKNVNVNVNVNEEGHSSGRPDRRRTAEVREVIDYLNAKARRSFRPVEANAKHVRARLNEGYTVEDCKRVIDLKVGEWQDEESSDGRDMSQYLRPETLFGAKFDSYLNAEPTRRSGPRISLVTGEPIDEQSPVRWGDAL